MEIVLEELQINKYYKSTNQTQNSKLRNYEALEDSLLLK